MSLIALVAYGCDSGAVSELPPTPQAAVSQVATPSPAPRNFSWVVDNQLGGMAHPGHGMGVDKSYDFLADQDVSLLISLTESPAQIEGLSERGIAQLHLPVIDFTAPELAQLETFIDETALELFWGGRVVVHCAAGQGRTGTFLAAWFVATGASAEEAIDHVRTMRPGSIETQAQLDIIAEYAESLH